MCSGIWPLCCASCHSTGSSSFAEDLAGPFRAAFFDLSWQNRLLVSETQWKAVTSWCVLRAVRRQR